MLAASERANAGTGESGLPVRVRLYQLRRDARLRNASFDEIWQNDAAILGDDLLDVVEQTAYPSRAHPVDIELEPEATALAAVALFKNPSGKDWFVVFDLPPVPAKPPCPSANARISVWVDRMKISDGQGRELR